MKLIYVAGPYRADTSIGVISNIYRATEVAYALWKMGWAVICPHMNTAHFKDLPHELILPGDLEMVKRCDAVLRLDGESMGADNEVMFAKSLGIPVYYSIKELE